MPGPANNHIFSFYVPPLPDNNFDDVRISDEAGNRLLDNGWKRRWNLLEKFLLSFHDLVTFSHLVNLYFDWEGSVYYGDLIDQITKSNLI